MAKKSKEAPVLYTIQGPNTDPKNPTNKLSLNAFAMKVWRTAEYNGEISDFTQQPTPKTRRVRRSDR